MIKTRTYHTNELTEGVCKSCGQYNQEILVGDGRCLDCIEADLFYEETMRDVNF